MEMLGQVSAGPMDCVSTFTDIGNRCGLAWIDSRRRLALAGLAILLLPSIGLSQQEEEQRFTPCPATTAPGLWVGIEGTVRADESAVPLPNATIRIRYQPRRGLPTPEEIVIEADDEGHYRVCGLQPFREIRLRATYSLRPGKERKITLESSQFLDLEIDLGKAAFLVFSVVAAEDGRPVQGARIELSPLPVAGITDSLGRVAFRSIPPGKYGIRVEHIGYASRDEEISVLTEQTAELRIELVTRAIAVAPLEVQITGRDPYLLTNGFYERQEMVGDSYFATYPEIKSYRMFRTLFQFKRELFIRFRNNPFVLLNGRPASRLGFTSIRSLNEINFDTVRGIEAYACSDAPPDMQKWLAIEVMTTNCNLIAIWTR